MGDGSSHYSSGQRAHFKTLIDIPQEIVMHHLVGTVRIKEWDIVELETEGERGGITLRNYLYILGMRVNLLSGEKAREQGWEYNFQGQAGGIIPVYRKDGKQICTIRESKTGRHTLICTPVRHDRQMEVEALVTCQMESADSVSTKSLKNKEIDRFGKNLQNLTFYIFLRR